MKKIFLLVIIVAATTIAPVQRSLAQDPISVIIKEGVKKVIKAVDLKIQRLQNQTIWLQNAQKTIENTMSTLKLDEITGWVEKQRTLYKDYFDELYKVKNVISYYQRIRDISEKQVLLLKEYKRAWNLFKQDKHFTVGEINFMAKVYAGIIDESAKNIDQVFVVIRSFETQMSDAKRLEIINVAAEHSEENYNDLTKFNQQNILLCLQRAKGQQDIDAVKKLYGLQ